MVVHQIWVRISLKEGAQVVPSQIKCKIIHNLAISASAVTASRSVHQVPPCSGKEAEVSNHLEWLDQRKKEHLSTTNNKITVKGSVDDQGRVVI